jgi:hypothetical protein
MMPGRADERERGAPAGDRRIERGQRREATSNELASTTVSPVERYATSRSSSEAHVRRTSSMYAAG